MKYYVIKHSCETKITGTSSTQILDSAAEYNFYDPRSSLMLGFSLANKNTLWPVGIVKHKSVKMTDLLSVSAMGLNQKLIVSEKLKNILFSKSTLGVQPIAIKIKKGDTEYNYWVIHPYKSDFSFLDFPSSVIGLTDRMLKNELDEVSFNSLEAFYNAFEKSQKDAITQGFDDFKPLQIRKAIIKPDNPYYFFAFYPLRNYSIAFVVSEKLKNEIIDAKCTGIEFFEL